MKICSVVDTVFHAGRTDGQADRLDEDNIKGTGGAITNTLWRCFKYCIF